ncbi:MAG: single-stranded-DNA-specific exonuclease RecJ [Deferrisomatales bacterium]|nr:single-stranded-DNA-specific exonuclease RecJ [Deferrisomatales bacterium]
MHRRWVLREPAAEARGSISRASGVSGLAASVLAARGIVEPEAVGAFLHPSLANLPDPSLLPGMDAAVGRLARAAEAGETVWVYTDYDVDGVTAAAVLGEFLRACRIPVRVRLPRRDREGYGLHPSALREIAEEGGTLVVTADCGVNAVEAGRAARELGIDLVVTDHHSPGDALPEAVAVVNPKLPASSYPDPSIAGVGVAWNLAAALRRRLREAGHFGSGGEPDLREALGLVALGTVADMAPLRDVNRVLVSWGLRALNRSPRAGIRALREVARVKGELRAGHLGFQLGPRLNAAGRMEGPQEALDLLQTGDPDRARALAQRLDRLNQERREEERGILGQAVERVEAEGWHPGRWSLAVESEGWHAGVVGIVASRLVERYHRPAVVLSVDGGSAKGSARSVRGLHLCEVLAECGGLLDRFGGHAAAAGLSLPAERVPEFRECFEAAVRARLSEEDLAPVLTLDAEPAFSELTVEAVRELSRLEPFGVGNPTPVLLSRRVRLLDVRPLGRDGAHAKLRLEQGGVRCEALAWRKARELGHARPGQWVDVAHTPQVNEWNGVERVQLVVEGMRPAPSG